MNWLPFGDVPEITPDRLQDRLAAGPVELVDVRTRLEYERGHIPGARSVPIHELPGRLDELDLDPDALVVAICKTAHRSVPAVRLLGDAGYDVVQLAGGMNRWRRHGGDER